VADSRYNIIYKGEISKGYEIGQVKRNLASLFKIDEKKIGPFFTGKSVVIKKNVEYDTAVKYAKTLKNAGASCKIQKISNAPLAKQSVKKPVKRAKNPAEKQLVKRPVKQAKNPAEKQLVKRPVKQAKNPAEKQSVKRPAKQTKKSLGNWDDSEEKTVEAMMACPKCGHEQPKAETCPYCGVVIKQYLKKVAAGRVKPPVKPSGQPGGRISDRTSDKISDQDAQADNEPDSFLVTLCRANADEGVEVRRIIKYAPIAGFAAGLVLGGIFDPWQALQKGGFIAAFLNCFLFGVCGIIGVLSMLGARNFEYAEKRSTLLLACFLCCGTWLSIFYLIDSFFDPSTAPASILPALFKLGYGFYAGGLISVLCAMKLSSVMIEDDSLDKPLVAIFCLLLVGNIVYKFMEPGPDGTTWKYNAQTSIQDINIYKDTVIALGNRGYVHALDKQNGERKWRFKRDTHTIKHPLIYKDLLFFVSLGLKKHYLNAIRADSGKVFKRIELLNFKPAGSAFYSGMLAIRSSLGDLYMVNLVDRFDVKQLEFEESSTPDIPPPVFSGSGVLCIGEEGSLVAIEMEDGEQLWRFSSEASSFNADIIVHKEKIYFPADNTIFAITDSDGMEEWRYQANEKILSMVIDDDVLYFGTMSKVYALDTEKGTIIWNYGKDQSFSFIAASYDTIYAIGYDKESTLYALDKTSGEKKWTKKLDLSPTAMEVENNMIYLAGINSRSKAFIYAINTMKAGK